jgi:4-hydroxybenzoate polyprenyltransferase
MNPEKKTGWIPWLDYFFVLRPMLFYPGWSTMLAGYFIYSTRTGYSIHWFSDAVNYKILFILLISFGSIMGSSFILNQIKDVVTDRQNKKLFILSGGLLDPHTLVLEAGVLAVISVVLAALVNIPVMVLTIVFFTVTGVLYNYAPFSMKDRPWGSLAANMIMGGLAFAIGWCAQQAYDPIMIQDLSPYLLFNTALYLFTTLPDIEGDRQAGKKTLAVRFGTPILIRVAFTVYLAGFVMAVLFNDIQALIIYVLSAPFFIRTIITFRITETLKATKFGILFFALTICLQWPLYFLLMVAGFYLTRFYFKYRFDFNYPNFSGN